MYTVLYVFKPKKTYRNVLSLVSSSNASPELGLADETSSNALDRAIASIVREG